MRIPVGAAPGGTHPAHAGTGAVLLSALATSVTAFTVLIGVGGLALVALMSWGLIRTWND